MTSNGFSISFSVIIATYNRCDYVQQTVESVLRQAYPAHEVIVVVDGSTDDTICMLREKYPSVVVRSQPNLGRSVARNTGIAVATGDWVCFIDDDDLWHQDKLRRTVEYLVEHPDCEAVNNPVWFFAEKEDGSEGGFGYRRDFVAATLEECQQQVAERDPSQNSFDYLKIYGDSFSRLLAQNSGVMSASVVRRDTAIRAGGFCPMQTCGEDWAFFLNVSRLCEWHTIPQRLGFTRLHQTQSTGDVDNALIILAGYINAWYTGRPLPSRTRQSEMLAELKSRGRAYRLTVQEFYWHAIISRQFSTARLVKQMGRLLLPNASDWRYAMTPPQVTWRWERYVLGMHK